MKKVITLVLLLLFNMPILYAYNTTKYWELTWFEKKILNLWWATCANYNQEDIPTIFIPGILASWYQEQWYKNNKIKRWLPDPITHVYDPLFFTFKRNWYTIKDVFYKNPYDIYIKWNPKKWFYLFWYDWKKDNKITASLLNKLAWLILQKYEKYNWCNIWKVNIIAHSMWWLVARSMLENMCVDLNKIKSNKVRWKINKSTTIPCKNPYFSDTIWKDIMVNKLITISTPHRWSPKSLPLWEKWDIVATDWFWSWNWLKYKLWLFLKGKEALYKLIHAYDDKIPNWIITIGQLLPDIKNDNNYNDSLMYFKNTETTKYNYPKNSFLEDLNKQQNINKIFSKVEWRYISYYSNITGNTGLNNIVWYDLKDKKFSYKWKDIYYKYKEKINENNYNIWKIYRDSYWKGWDWTVPSLNLRLVPNDSITWKEITNNKFESREIKCESNSLYQNIWLSTNNELCSHSNMTIASAYKILLDILWKDSIYNPKSHKISLIYNLWYTNYKSSIMDYNFTNKNFIASENKIVNWNIKYSLKLWKLSNIMTYEILSPINIMVEDSLWRKIWVDPETWMIINEIPWAFTSWNTEWSGEPEFFYIPVKLNEKQKITTIWTWSWKYHIVYKNYNLNNNTSTGSVIIWNTREKLQDIYIIDKKWNDLKSTTISKNIYKTLEQIKVEKNFNTIYKNKLQEIKNKINKFTIFEKNRLKRYIQENKEKLIDNQLGNLNRKRYRFFLNKILDYILLDI